MPRTNEYNWVFGANDRLEFANGGEPLAYTDAASGAYEGCATISDSAGALVAYSDGVNLWDGTHNSILSNLSGNSSSTHSCIMVPPAGGDSHYHLFVVSDDQGAQSDDNVFHSTFSYNGMSIQQELGEANITGPLPVPQNLNYDNTERLAATTHEDCENYWVLTQRALGAGFHAFLVDSDLRPTQPVYSPTSFPIPTGANPVESGYMKFSPDGSLLAYARRSTCGDDILVHRFNKTTGVLTDFMRITNAADPYGLEFSPNSQILYFSSITNRRVYAHVIGPGTVNITATTGLFTMPGINNNISALQLGPNGKIYGKTSTTSLLSIDDPDVFNPPGLLPTITYPAVGSDNSAIQLSALSASTLSLPTFTRVANECADPLCDLTIIDQRCDENGNTVITLNMENNSQNGGVSLSLELSGIPDNMYSVTSSSSGNIYEATILIDGIFSGPIDIVASLNGFSGSVGSRLCCKREKSLQIDPCADECLKIEGEWVNWGLCFLPNWGYQVTVTNISTNTSFNPAEVSITNLPPNVILYPNPIQMTSGTGMANIFVADSIPAGTVLGLLFHTENMDMCCNKWINITVPEKPNISLIGPVIDLLGKFRASKNAKRL